MSNNDDRVQCQICKEYFKLLTETHLKKHGITFKEYFKLYPGAKTVSESVQVKRSKSLTGRTLSPETKYKCGNGSRDRVQTEEEKEKRRQSNILACTDEVKKRISDAISGEKHYNWQGGISYEPYCKKFNEKFKESIRKKFNRVCFICGCTEKENGCKLDVHHVSYNKLCLCDGIVCEFAALCKSCHTKTNRNRDYWERYIMKKLELDGRKFISKFKQGVLDEWT